MRLISMLIAAFSLLLGAALFFAPQAAAPIWFWNLTPHTARALAAWPVAIAVLSAQVVWEDDSVLIVGAFGWLGMRSGIKVR
jgi:hypothetical protein